ncbi:uncharacterized protein [Antennarius striatus]|uniref:uncharacterized protein isoform X2 n=1 Tax=Antennarius striatus TaxID=241820 RepID=UPI0035B1DBE0
MCGGCLNGSLASSHLQKHALQVDWLVSDNCRCECLSTCSSTMHWRHARSISLPNAPVGCDRLPRPAMVEEAVLERMRTKDLHPGPKTKDLHPGPRTCTLDQGPRTCTLDQGPRTCTMDQGPAPWTKDQGPAPWTKDQGPAPWTKDQGPAPWLSLQLEGTWGAKLTQGTPILLVHSCPAGLFIPSIEVKIHVPKACEGTMQSQTSQDRANILLVL